MTELSLSKNTEQFSIRERYVQRKLSREIYKCKEMVYINTPMKTELKIIIDVLSNHTKYNLKTPIAHVIDRDPEYVSYGDASLEAAGGFSEENFW